MKEKPELLSLSSCARRREQKASTSKTSSSCVHMRPGRAKYDAALFQSFCKDFAHIIKLLSSSRKCLKYLLCDVKMTSARGHLQVFVSSILNYGLLGSKNLRHVAKLLSWSSGFSWVFLSQFLHLLQFGNRSGSFALQTPLNISFLEVFLVQIFSENIYFVLKENGRTFKKINSGIVNVICNSNQNETQGNLEIPQSFGKVGIKI